MTARQKERRLEDFSGNIDLVEELETGGHED
jgi:hypothetical protein